LSVDLSCEVVAKNVGRLYPDVVVDGKDCISAQFSLLKSEMGFGEKEMEMLPCDIPSCEERVYARSNLRSHVGLE
jgi:hypothetical protein